MPNIDSATNINSIQMKEQASAPATPASGQGQLYVKTDGLLYFKNDGGTEYDLTSGTLNLGDLADVNDTASITGQPLTYASGSGTWGLNYLVTYLKSENTVPSAGAIATSSPVIYCDAGTVDTITDSGANKVIWLRPKDTTDQVILQHGVGNITTPDGNDIVLYSRDQWVMISPDISGYHVICKPFQWTSEEITADPANANPYNLYIADTSGGAFTITLPDVTANDYGKQYAIKLETAGNNLTVTTVGGTQTINGSTSITLSTAKETIVIQANPESLQYEIVSDNRPDLSLATGTLGIGSGGTGQTTQTAAFDGLSPTTTKGDIIVDDGTNAVRQAIGTNDYALVADSAQTNGLKWADIFVKNTGGDTMAPKLTLSDSATTPPLNVTERSTAPSSPSSGDIYLDDGTNTGSGNPGWRRYTGATWEDITAAAGGAGGTDRLYYADTATTNLTNTATETTIYSFTVTGGDLGTNDALEFTIIGHIVENAANEPTFRLKYGSTTVYTFVTITHTLYSFPVPFVIKGYLKGDGSTAAQAGLLTFPTIIEQQSSLHNISIATTGTNGEGSATETSTGNLTLAITCQWSGASASSIIEFNHLSVLYIQDS